MAQTRVFMTKHWETGYSWLVRLRHKEEHVTRLASDKCCLLTKEEIKPKGWTAKERAREWVGMSCVCHQTATPVKSGRIRPKVHMQHKKTVAVIVICNRFKHFQPHFLCLEEKAVAVGLREATVDFGWLDETDVQWRITNVQWSQRWCWVCCAPRNHDRGCRSNLVYGYMCECAFSIHPDCLWANIWNDS